MARKIVLKEDGLSGTAPEGYKYVGFSGEIFSEITGTETTPIGGDGAEPLKYKCLLSQNTPEFDMSLSIMIAGQIWELSDVAAHPSSQAFLDTLELVSGTLYALGSKYRAAIDTPFSIPETIMTYDGSPYIVSTNSDGDFAPFINTLGEEPIFSLPTTGRHRATITSSLFVKSKTSIKIDNFNVGSKQATTVNQIDWKTFNADESAEVDDKLGYTPFEIEIYP